MFMLLFLVYVTFQHEALFNTHSFFPYQIKFSSLNTGAPHTPRPLNNFLDMPLTNINTNSTDNYSV